MIAEDSLTLREALRKPATSHAIDLVIAATGDLFETGLPSPPTTPNPNDTSRPPISLPKFMKTVARRARCTVGTMVVTYIFIKRLGARLGSLATPCNEPYSYHRVIFSSTMLAHKLSNDSSMVGKHWAEVSSDLFDCHELLNMERDFLCLLHYDVEITMNDVIRYAPRFLDLPSSLLDRTKDGYPAIKGETPPLPLKSKFQSLSSPCSSPVLPPVDSYHGNVIRRYRPGPNYF